MPEYKYAKGRIADSLQFISREMEEFDRDYQGASWKDYNEDPKLQKLMDRTVENILTALIEVCGTVCAEEGGKVESYAQVLQSCGALLGFSEQESGGLSSLAAQRNRLAHRYLNFRWQAVSAYKKQKETILRLLEKILEREERKYNPDQ